MNDTKEGDGWGVVDGESIDMRTVGPTRRSAIVNWLWVRGVIVTEMHTDRHIDALWDAHRAEAAVRQVRVQILEER